jgi:hypothetical protein
VNSAKTYSFDATIKRIRRESGIAQRRDAASRAAAQHRHLS